MHVFTLQKFQYSNLSTWSRWMNINYTLKSKEDIAITLLMYHCQLKQLLLLLSIKYMMKLLLFVVYM